MSQVKRPRNTVGDLPNAATPNAIAVFDIDGVVRDVAGSYRRAISDTVEHFTQGGYRPSLSDIDALKAEGCWNNDWKASEELIFRFYETQNQPRQAIALDYSELVEFFQSRYRGDNFSGYIQDEPLLLTSNYLEDLSQAGIGWGFFSGATRGSATYVLEQRLGLQSPILVAMEDAPSKPDPTGLMATVRQIMPALAKSPHADAAIADVPVLYIGDTVADMQTVQNAQADHPNWTWIGIGILPPHVQRHREYAQQLILAGAVSVLRNVQELTPKSIQSLLEGHDLLQRAIAIATQCHQTQVDKAGNPYISHPFSVMNHLPTLPEKIVGVLHDTVEDSDLTLSDLTTAGFPADIVKAVDAITQRDQEAYDAYLARVMSNPTALRVKIADMTDNMDISRIAEPTEKDHARLRKYQAILPRLQSALTQMSDTQ